MLIFKGFWVVWVGFLGKGWKGSGLYIGYIIVVYWGFCVCLYGFCGVYARFMQCMQFIVYSSGERFADFFTVPPSGVWWAFRCWWAAGSGSLLLLVGVGSGGLNLKESRCFKFGHIPLKIGGILHFFGVFGGRFSLRLVHLFTHN